MSKLGVIAGKGDLPRKVIETCVREGRDFFVIALKGQTDKDLIKNVPHYWVKLGATEETIRTLKSESVTDIVMVGGVNRPGVFDIKPDLRTMQIIADVGISSLGDDTLLKAISRELEKEGFKVVGAHEIVPDILSPKGILTEKQPNESNKSDIEEGIKAAKTIGNLDIGQSVIVQQGVVIAVEAVEGTDEIISRYAKYKYKNGYQGVLVKTSKPNQDRRIDLPTIGTRTVKNAYNAGLSGIVVEAGASIILDRDETVKLADSLGLFIIGFEVKA